MTADDSIEERPKRRHSVSRILQKLKPKKRKSGDGKDLGFMSLQSSSTDLSSLNSDSSSLLRRGSMMETRSSSLKRLTPVGEKFVALSTFNCVMFHPGGALQGRLYLTDSFFVFDSRTLIASVRIKMNWKEVFGIRLSMFEGEPTVLINGVQERYNFGRFLLTQSLSMQSILQELNKTWASATRKKALDESKLLQGPRWPCGCLSHLNDVVLGNQMVKALPYELFDKICQRSVWLSTFKAFQNMEVHGDEKDFEPQAEGGKRTITHIIRKEDGLVKIRQVQTLEAFTAELISVRSSFVQDEKEVANSRHCFVKENNFLLEASRVFTSFEGESQIVRRTYEKFYAEEFRKRFTFLKYTDEKEEVCLLDNVKMACGVWVKPRIGMLEENILIIVAIVLLYFIGSLLRQFIEHLNRTEPLFVLLPDLENCSAVHLKEDIVNAITELERVFDE